MRELLYACPKCAAYLYTHRPKLGVALSGQEEVLRDVLGDLGHGRLDHSSGGSKCAQFGGLIIEVGRRDRPGPPPVYIILVVVVVFIVEESSYTRESTE